MFGTIRQIETKCVVTRKKRRKGKLNMKRTDLEAWGLTEEQIESVMTQNGKDIQNEKAKASSKDDELNALRESARELEELKKQNMSEIELANSERDKALKAMKELDDKVKRMELKSSFAENGITGEDADKLLESIGNGSIDVSLLGKIIASKQEEAINNKIAELSAQTIQPNQGSIDKPETKSDADKFVESIVSDLKGGDTQSIIDAYK